jgi:hypothetical protein
MRGSVASHYFREISTKVNGAVLYAESGLIMLGSDRTPQLLQMSSSIRNGDEPSARTNHSRQFRQSTVKREDVIKHPGSDHGVKGTVWERKIAGIAQNRFYPKRGTRRDHCG